MSEQSAYCFYCEALRAKDAGNTHVSVLEVEHKHGGEMVYVVQVNVGGDMAKCVQFADMVAKYVNEVLGNKAVCHFTAGSTGKAN